jgi:hypothetical protein
MKGTLWRAGRFNVQPDNSLAQNQMLAAVP